MRSPSPIWQKLGCILLFFAIALSSCSIRNPISERKIDTTYSGTFRNILIVSVGENRSQSLEFEEAIAARLKANETMALSFTESLGLDSVPDENVVVKLAQENKSDGVLVTRLAALEISQKTRPEKTVTTVRTGGIYLDGYHPYEFAETTDPSSVSRNATVSIVTELYLMETGKQIWQIQSSSFQREDAVLIVHENAELIVNQLLKDKLIKAN